MRDFSGWQIIVGIGGALAALLVVTGRTPPDQFVSNNSQWVRAVWPNAPTWLASSNTDLVIYRGSRLALAVLLPFAIFSFLDFQTMRVGPKILIVGGCVAIIGGMIWHWGQPNVVASALPKEGSAPAALSIVEPPAAQVPPPAAQPPAVHIPPPGAAQNKSVEWHFPEGPFHNKSAEMLFGIAVGSAGYWAVWYRLSGTNRTGEMLTSVRAYVIPTNSGKRIPLQYELNNNTRIDTDEGNIEPSATFILVGRIPGSAREEGVATVEEYLARYGGFTFEFECAELPKISRSFTYADVSQMLNLNKKDYENFYRPPPGITRKD
jgi:hypothetical protein